MNPIDHRNDPLYGKTLEEIVTFLVAEYGFEGLAEDIKIKCFTTNPSIKSSLKFLRKTKWARDQVESLYIETIRRTESRKSTDFQNSL